MKYKTWHLGELVEKEILCPACSSPDLEYLYSDCDRYAYWTMYRCERCGKKFVDDPGGSEL